MQEDVARVEFQRIRDWEVALRFEELKDTLGITGRIVSRTRIRNEAVQWEVEVWKGLVRRRVRK